MMISRLSRKIAVRFIGKKILAVGMFFVALSLAAGQYGDFSYAVNGAEITITGYVGKGGDVTIPNYFYNNYVTSIGSGAFGGCSTLTSVVIPDRIRNIGEQAFWNCTALKTVTIGSRVTKIGSQAFWCCSSLTDITIGARLTNIGNQAFLACSSLVAISVDQGNSRYCSVDGVLFNKTKTTLIQYPGGKIGSYEVPSSVTTIGDNAFQACRGITDITIGPNVKKIGNGTFSQCSSLASAFFLGKAPTAGAGLFDFCANGFTVYFIEGSKGFALPFWYGYPSSYFTLGVLFSAADGGLINSSSKLLLRNVGYGQDCASVTATPDDGYHFVSWTGDLDSSANPLVVPKVTKNMNITANFAVNSPGTFTVTFLAGDGGTVSGIASQNVASGADCSPVISLSNAGYHFIGWSGDAVGEGNPLRITNVTKDMNIAANFAFMPDTANLTMAVSQEDGGTTEPATGSSSQSTGQAIAITANPASGYTFTGWSATANGSVASFKNSSTTVTIIGDTTVTANFARNVTLDMALNPQAGGVVFPPVGASQVGMGASQDIIATPSNGYRFLNWTATANASLANPAVPSTTVILSGDAIVTANFALIPLTAALTMAANLEAGGSTTPVPGISQVSTQVAMGITAVPFKTYHFLRWTATENAEITDCNSPATTVILFGDAAITAVFEVDTDTATLTMAASPADGGSTDPIGSSIHGTGLPIAITATAAEGYSFISWSASNANAVFADKTAEITSVIIRGDVEVTAKFGSWASAEDMAYGRIYNLGAWSVPGIIDFTGTPKIYAKYQLRPADEKSKNSSLYVATKIAKGASADSIVCEWTGIVSLLDKSVWSDTTSTTEQLLAENPPEPLLCRLFASVTDSNNTVVKDVYTNIILSLLPPEITDVKNQKGESISSINTTVTGQKIFVSGKLFGKTVPSVWMEYPVYEKDGVTFKGIKQLALKVDKSSLNVNGPDVKGKASAMNIESGISEISVIIPDKWPNGWQAGQHNIVIDNKVCRATYRFQTE